MLRVGRDGPEGTTGVEAVRAGHERHVRVFRAHVIMQIERLTAD